MVSVLIVGSTGMLGYTLLRHLAADPRYEVHATVRESQPRHGFTAPPAATLHLGHDVRSDGQISQLIRDIRPQFVINCVGLIKQLQGSNGAIPTIQLNALFPHRLAATCSDVGSRLVHFSTDCVFSGNRGEYRESDFADADDLYGRSKRLGEIAGPGHLTLRTSLIGHELRSGVSLVDWFLNQTGPIEGYRGARFSGLPTVSVARFLTDHVLRKDSGVEGLYHLASTPIDKFTLLSKIAGVYGHMIEIVPSDSLKIDRSLDGSRLIQATGYQPPSWDHMINEMYDDYQRSYRPWRVSS